MTLRYVRTLSWHLSRTDGRTLCGRVPSTAAERSDDLPSVNVKTCERCWQLAARVIDAAPEILSPAPTIDEAPVGDPVEQGESDL